MKIALLGATGGVGLEVIKQGLDRGHEIKALVRSPDKIKIQHERLEVKKINIFSEDDLSVHIPGSDIIISCLGGQPSLFNRTPVSLYSDVTKVLVDVMRKSSVRWFMFVSAWFPKSEPGNSFCMEWILRPILLGNILKNMAETEEYLQEQCQDIEFTSVRPPGLTNGKVTDKPIKCEAGKCVPGASSSMSRADVARFMLDCAENGQWKNTCVAIAV